eukprot:gene23907-29008_t
MTGSQSACTSLQPYASVRSVESKQLGYVHFNAGMYAGKAGKLAAMFQDIGMRPFEEGQDLLKEYWYANSEKIVLDYNSELFAVTSGQAEERYSKAGAKEKVVFAAAATEQGDAELLKTSVSGRLFQKNREDNGMARQAFQLQYCLP